MMMNYSHKESGVLEFKRKVPNKKQTILKTVIGFANTYGGQIIVGVDDDGEIHGVPDEQTDQIIDDLTRSIYDSVAPSLFTSIFTKRFGDKLVVIIDVAEGLNKPYHFSSERVANSTYVRLGAHTMLASPEMIQQLQWQQQRKFLDEMPVYEASKDDVDVTAFKRFLNDRKQKNNKTDVNEMLYHYKVLVKDRGRVYPTVGGLLLFGKQPEKFYSEAFVICTHFLGTSGREVVATKDSAGNLFQQYKDTEAFILSRLNTSFTIEGTGRRKEYLEIPREAIREVVLNAIVHRNYQIMGPSKIFIYDDRLEIFTPGNFPGPIIADKVDIGVTYIRNAIVSKVFRDIGLIEKLGSGFITLFESYKKRNLPQPVIIEGVGFVKCTLPRPIMQAKKMIGSEEKMILQLFLEKTEINAHDVMVVLSTSRSTANRLLTKLMDAGDIKKIGKGPTTRYRKTS